MANTVTQSCREIIKKNSDLRMNQARVANRVKKKEQTNQPTASKAINQFSELLQDNKIARKVSTPVLNVKVRDVIG